MQIGRKIYYDKLSGNIIQDTGERNGSVVETTIEQDFQNYVSLKERIIDTVGVIQLDYGQYRIDFMECDGYRINPETLELEFSYPDPNTPTEEPVYQKPLSEHVKELEQQNTDLMLAIAEMAEANELEKTETQLAIAELAEIVSGGVK